MNILKRYKDRSGSTIAYDIECNGVVKKVSKDEAIFFRDSITNANFISTSGEFRAKPRCHIETVVDNSNLGVKSRTALANVTPSQRLENDFYGRQYIKVCKRIRQCAIAGFVHVERRVHRSNMGLNTHLFSLIEACDMSLDDFVSGYLSVLQPYSLAPFQGTKNKDNNKNFIVVKDIGYGIEFIIKIKIESNHDALVVSFHESNNRGSNSLGGHTFGDMLCAVLVDNVTSRGNSGFGVEYTVQRGFLRTSVHSFVQYYKNGIALVRYAEIKHQFDGLMQNILNRLSELHLSVSDVPVITQETNKLSFMSYGHATINNICYLLDLYTHFKSVANDRVVIMGIALAIIDEMPDYKKAELKIALDNRYKNSNNKLYIAIREVL